MPINSRDHLITSYDEMPSLYDFEYPTCDGDELDFWDGMLREYGGPALELAVGTGRVAIPLASRGHTICGIDVSQPMLDRALLKQSKLPRATRARLHFSRQDMRNFTFRQRFKVIYAPFNSLLLLTLDQDFADCMNAVTRHLDDQGTFVVEAFAMADDDQVADSETVTYLEIEPDSGATVTRTRDYSFDPTTRSALSDLSYTLEHGSGRVDEIRFQYVLQLYRTTQLLDRLKKYGFSIRNVYDAVTGQKYTRDSDGLVVVCGLHGHDDFDGDGTVTQFRE